ncbi:hypothetical protein FBUS_05463 [Fasciolopsis buskii]|uniref:Uncharacterized protein n=1 Tax=Fasciolopsis buskii TaxID=27845 RepID=A0A8E0VJ04_9TREM|nr:hypothetical protein FBUS_05463 [Fasciolopsis buski]
MQMWNTSNYVSKKFTVRECPVILAQLLNTSNVRFALLKTNCYLDIQSRVLNWRHRATPWTKGAIVEVAGPDYSSIDQCNEMIESVVPFYAIRRPYVEITSCKAPRLFRKRATEDMRGNCRASSSIPAPDLHRSQESVRNVVKQNAFTPDPMVPVQNQENRPVGKQTGFNNSKYPVIEPRLPRSRALSSQTYHTEECVDSDTFQKDLKLSTDYPVPRGDEFQPTLEQNRHNATGVCEFPLKLKTDPFPPRSMKLMSDCRTGTYPRPKLFESERSARFAVHTQKAAAVRAILEQMKEEKYRHLLSTVSHNLPRQNPSDVVNRLLKCGVTRSTTPKTLGDPGGRLPICSSPSLDTRDIHLARSWDRLSGSLKSHPPADLSKLISVSITGTPRGSPSILNILHNTHRDIQQYRSTQNTLTGKTGPISKEASITTGAQLARYSDKVTKQSRDRGETDRSKGLVATSNLPKCNSTPVNRPDTLTDDGLIEHPQLEVLSGSQNFFDPCPTLIYPNALTVSSSHSSHILSSTSINNGEPECTECGECRLEGLNCSPLNLAQLSGKTLTDAAEYRRKMHHDAPKTLTQQDVSMNSEFNNLEPPVQSLHIPASALARPQSTYEPQCLPNEVTEFAPNQQLSITPTLSPYGESHLVVGTKVKLGELSSVRPTAPSMTAPFHPNRSFRPRLFERIDFCSHETTETQDVLLSNTYEHPLEIDLGQLPRRSEIRIEDPQSGHAVGDDTLFVPNIDGEPSNIITLSCLPGEEIESKPEVFKKSVSKDGQKFCEENMMDSSAVAKISQDRGESNPVSLVKQIFEPTKSPSRLTNPDSSTRNRVGDSVLVGSQKDLSRVTKETKALPRAPSKELVNRSLWKSKPKILQAINADRNRKEISQRGPATNPKVFGRTVISRSVSKLGAVRNTTIPRSVNKTVNSITRTVSEGQPMNDLSAPNSKTSRQVPKATGLSLCGSYPPSPLSLAEPCMTIPDPSKRPESTDETKNRKSADSGLLERPNRLIETPQTGLFLRPDISLDHISSVTSTAKLPDYLYSDSSHGYEEEGSHSGERNPLISCSEEASVVEDSESMTETTSDESSESPTASSSDNETANLFPKNRENRKRFTSMETQKLARETGRLQRVSAFTGQKRLPNGYGSREIYQTGNAVKRRIPNRVAAERRKKSNPYLRRKWRYRSHGIYNKVVGCFPLQWCFRNG